MPLLAIWVLDTPLLALGPSLACLIIAAGQLRGGKETSWLAILPLSLYVHYGDRYCGSSVLP